MVGEKQNRLGPCSVQAVSIIVVKISIGIKLDLI